MGQYWPTGQVPMLWQLKQGAEGLTRRQYIRKKYRRATCLYSGYHSPHSILLHAVL